MGFLVMVNILVLSRGSFGLIFLLLEISIVLFITLVYISKGSLRACFKYFIIQSGSSFLFVSSFVLIRVASPLVLLIRLLVKIRFFPFHQWALSLRIKLEWDIVYMLLVVQKLGPYWVIREIISVPWYKFVLLVCRINSVVSFIGACGQVNLRLLYSYLSLRHQSWLLLGCLLDFISSFFYLLVYSLIRIPFILVIFKGSIILPSLYFEGEFIYFLSVCLLMGLPPGSGFFLKVMIVLMFIYDGLLSVALVLGGLALLGLFTYSRLFFFSLISCYGGPSSKLLTSGSQIFRLVLFFLGPLVCCLF